MGAKPSHGPLIAILVGTAVVVIAACGGAAFLLARGVSGIERVAEVRRGPTEVVDDDYRVRVTRPTDGRSWELWDRELAASWYTDTIVVLRDDGCSAGLVVAPASRSRTLDEQLRASLPELTSRAVSAPSGADGDARTLGPDEEGETSFAFTHGGMLYRVVGRGRCTTRLFASIEMLPGPVVARWTTPPIENAFGRSYRVVDRVFESAASGLHVDASEPFSLELDDLARNYGHAELAVRHRNGTVIALDPSFDVRPSPPSVEQVSSVVSVFGQPTRFDQVDPSLDVWGGVAVHPSAMAVGMVASGPDRESVIEALEALALRIDVIDGDRLAVLRGSMPAPDDRRAGVGWSFRGGVLREHPSEPRPRLELVVPEWTEVFAGSEIDPRDLDASDGIVALLERRDLGVSGRVAVRASRGAGGARGEVEALAAFEGATVTRGPVEGDATHAWTEVVLDEHRDEERVTRIEVLVRDRWAFVIELWWPRIRDERAVDYARGVAELLAIERPFVSGGPRHRDERLGFVFDPAGRRLRERADEADGVEAFAFVSTLSDLNEGTMLIAASDPRPSACRAVAFDHLHLNRSAAALVSIVAEDASLDGHPATVRTITDVGFETRLVEARIDRTTYLVAIRTLVGGDWQGELARVDLGP
ncbi:MAG: hypothetical protein J0L92_26840 [Deltaproteobacteria bacterium]|nr:hypothetical protein [Deltaproteobacteria bacterium]